ncbi:hypothetical protein BGX33_004703 [Mortierella sp. NVP41]|nr:hypothetical protein BGX33_004703 [Mortierella sp. NVP41]
MGQEQHISLLMENLDLGEDQGVHPVAPGPFEFNVVLRTNPLTGHFPCLVDENTNNNLATLTGTLLHHFPDLPRMGTDISATPGQLRVHHPRHIADVSFFGNTHYPLVDERQIYHIIEQYRMLGRRELVLDWETPLFELANFTFRQFIALYGTNGSSLDALAGGHPVEMKPALLDTQDLEFELDWICNEFESTIRPHLDAGWDADGAHAVYEKMMKRVAHYLLAFAVGLFDGVTLGFDKRVGGCLGTGKADYKVKLPPGKSDTSSSRTDLVAMLVLNGKVNDAVARTLVMLDQLSRERYLAAKIKQTTIKYGIVTDGSKWYLLECVQEAADDQEGGTLPPPRFWVTKLPSEIGFAGDHEWVGPGDIFKCIVKQLLTIV